MNVVERIGASTINRTRRLLYGLGFMVEGQVSGTALSPNAGAPQYELGFGSMLI